MIVLFVLIAFKFVNPEFSSNLLTILYQIKVHNVEVIKMINSFTKIKSHDSRTCFQSKQSHVWFPFIQLSFS